MFNSRIVTKKQKTTIISKDIIEVEDKNNKIVLEGNDIVDQIYKSILYFKHNQILNRVKDLKKSKKEIKVVELKKEDIDVLNQVFKVRNTKHVFGIPVKEIRPQPEPGLRPDPFEGAFEEDKELQEDPFVKELLKSINTSSL